MAWIESHQTLKDHPKTRRLARYLKISVPAAIGHLHCLWWWALDYAQDGDLSRYEPEDIADAAMWEGDAAEFVTALVKAGFLDQDGECLRIHDWDDYTGRLITEIETKRERKREWMRRYRAEKRTRVESTSSECGIHVDSTRGQRSNHVDAIPNLTIPNHTIHNQEDTCAPDRKIYPLVGGGGDKSGVEGLREEGEKSSASAALQENLYTLFQGEFCRPLSPMEVEQINFWAKKYSPELLREALRRAVLNGKLSMRYIDRILLRWEKENIRCLREVQEKDPLDGESASRVGQAGESNGLAVQSRAGPAGGSNVVDLEKKRREEKINAALSYFRIRYGQRLPPREEAEKLALEYGEDVADEILRRVYQNAGSERPP